MEAIISDVHANAPALKAVLRDIRDQGIKRIRCLGDVIGYGPNPRSCIDAAMNFRTCLRGNHEQALLVEMEANVFNDKAKGSLEWTRRQLSMLGDDKDANSQRWNFLGDLPDSVEEDDVLYVHGSPRGHTMEYVYPRDARDREKMSAVFKHMEHICFAGHSHIPGIWTEDNAYLTPENIDNNYRLANDTKSLINVGSVGQPRDGDVRASYVVFDGKSVQFRRVAYPVERTIEMMEKINALPSALSKRLRDGR